MAVRDRARTAVARTANAIAGRFGRLPAIAQEVPSAEERAARREMVDNEHLELLVGFLLQPGSNCIDVGANEGRFLAHFVNRAPHGTHLAFEPIPWHAQALRKAYPRVDVHESALSDRRGEAEFVLVPESTGYSGLRERTYPAAFRTERIRVAVERLDDVVDEGYVPTLVKVDVEGAEAGVFRGGLETLARHRPVVVFEHGMGGANHYGTAPEEIHELLVDQVGLRIFDMDANGPYSRDEMSEMFYSGRCWNWVAKR